MKICTGTLKPDSTIYNVNKDAEEKVAKIYVLRGKDAIEVPELKAGDIGAVAKLTVTQTGDTMAVRTAPIVYHAPKISVPYTYMSYSAKTKGDEDKVSSALAKLMEEDLTLKAVNDSENRQSLLYGIGDQQLEVVVSCLLYTSGRWTGGQASGNCFKARAVLSSFEGGCYRVKMVTGNGQEFCIIHQEPIPEQTEGYVQVEKEKLYVYELAVD